MWYIILHRYISYIMGVIVAFMAITGGWWAVSYRLLKAEKTSVKWLLNWHQGDILNIDSSGSKIKAPFCIAVLCGVIFLGLTGMLQLNCKSLKYNRNSTKRRHQLFAILGGFPLIFGALTGGIWAFLR